MDDPTQFGSVCQCERCTGEQTTQEWPKWATPSEDDRLTEDVETGGKT